jgi:hypothetical protein
LEVRPKKFKKKGKIDEKNFSHYIEVGELKPQPEYKAIDNFKTSKTLIHWTNYPNSYDQWINKPVDEIFQKPTKKIWKLVNFLCFKTQRLENI